MTSNDFALWLHGFTELTGGTKPTDAQWKMIVEHLDLVFDKVTKPLDEPKTQSVNMEGPSPRDQWEKHVQHEEKIAAKKGFRPNIAEALKKAAEQERQAQEAKRIQDYYKDRTRVVPGAPVVPQPFMPTPFYPQAPQPFMPYSPTPFQLDPGKLGVITC